MMQRASSLEKTLMLGKIEGKRRSGQQRMRWLDGITDSMETYSRVAHQAPLSRNFPGKDTGAGCHFLLQGILLTQRSLLHWQVGSLPLSHLRSSPGDNFLNYFYGESNRCEGIKHKLKFIPQYLIHSLGIIIINKFYL